LLAMYDGASRGVGLASIAREMEASRVRSWVKICTDSSVAKSFSATRGLGRMRHVEVKLLWLQELVRKDRARAQQVGGATNVADTLTKYQNAKDLHALTVPHGIVCGLGGGSRQDDGRVWTEFLSVVCNVVCVRVRGLHRCLCVAAA